MIDLAIQPLLDEKDVYVSNLTAELNEDEWKDPGEIKVVCDLKMNAMYMSRAPMPSIDHEEQRAKWYKQICIMPFRWHFMKKFNDELESTPLELQESIEMIRAIQHGYKVRMVPSPYISKSVDTDLDRIQAEKLMFSDPVYPLYKEL
jgi:3-deoxy-manno-octulosonate cytidylyltransferase (CMP-KDO synthetase)